MTPANEWYTQMTAFCKKSNDRLPTALCTGMLHQVKQYDVAWGTQNYNIVSFAGRPITSVTTTIEEHHEHQSLQKYYILTLGPLIVTLTLDYQGI